MASSGRDTGRERLLKRPTSLLSQRCLRNAFLLAPLAPCVDALSAGCVLHVKQAADAVRKRDQEGQGGPGHKEAPLPCHPPGLASLCCHHPLRSSPPTTPLITSPLNSNPPPPPPPPPPPIPAPFPFNMPPLYHPIPLHPPPPSPGHPSATLPAHAVVCLLGNKLWLVYGGTLSSDTHTHRHTNTHTHTHTSVDRKTWETAFWTERKKARRERGGREEGEWSPLIKWFFTVLLCIFGLTWLHSGEIINKCMAYINIAFDSRQVAGWEQMLGGRPERERLSERERWGIITRSCSSNTIQHAIRVFYTLWSF